MCMHNNGEPSFVANTPDCHSLFQLAFFIVLSRIPCSLGIPDQLLCDTLVNRPITKRANPMQVHPIRSRVTVDIRRHSTSLTIVPAESTRVFGVQRKLSWFGAGVSGVKREQCAFTNDFCLKDFRFTQLARERKKGEGGPFPGGFHGCFVRRATSFSRVSSAVPSSCSWVAPAVIPARGPTPGRPVHQARGTRQTEPCSSSSQLGQSAARQRN